MTELGNLQRVLGICAPQQEILALAREIVPEYQGNEQLRALRGKVTIDYDWQAVEAEEVRLQARRESRLGGAR